MSVKLRMARLGRHNDPYYRIVAADSRYAADGRYIEQIGRFDPETNKAEINEELAMKWLKAGALPSDSIKTLLTEIGLMAKYNASKGPSHKKSKTVKKNKFDRPAKPKAKKEAPKKVVPTMNKEEKKVEAPKTEEKKGE